MTGTTSSAEEVSALRQAPAVSAGSIAVAICCYTVLRWDSIRAAVTAVMDQLDPVTDGLVLVVDHCPELLRLARSTFRGISVLENSGPPGLSGARNCAVAESNSDIIVFLDDDAIPHAGWIEGIRHAFDSPELDMAGGAVTPRWPGGRQPLWFPAEFDWVVGCDYRGMSPVGSAIRNPIGANMAVRRNRLESAGGFSSNLGRNRGLPAGCEETELAIRLTQHNPAGSIRRIADTSVVHHVSTDRCTRRYFLRRCLHEGRSKAAMVELLGSVAPLQTEWRYATRTLPRAIALHLVPSVRKEEYHPSRALWIILGLTATGVGWITGARVGKIGTAQSTRDASTDSAVEFVPVPITELDLTALPENEHFPRPNSEGRLRILTLLQRSPLGIAELEYLTVGGHGSEVGRTNKEVYLDSVIDRFSDRIAEHLHALPQSAGSPMSVEQFLAAPYRIADLPNPRFGESKATPITAVVCSIGRSDRLRQTVEAMLVQSHLAVEVIVVDNAPSSGDVRRILAGLHAANLTIIEESIRGVSHARNTGLRRCTDDLIAFTDDDVVPDNRWLERIVDAFSADDSVRIGCVTGLVLPAEFEVQEQMWFEQSSGFDKGFDTLVWNRAGAATPDTAFAASTATPDSLARTGAAGPVYPYAGSEFGSGNNMAFRTDALRAVGGFDPLLGTGSPARGGEDLDIFRRMILSGNTLVYSPAAMVRHFHRRDYRALRRQMYDYGVGMSANLFRHMLRGPRQTTQILGVIPIGVKVLLDPNSVKNEGKAREHPLELTLLELAGYLTGPAHLAWSAYRARRSRSRGAGAGAGRRIS